MNNTTENNTKIEEVAENMENKTVIVDPESIETIKIVEKIIQTDVKDIVFKGMKIHGADDAVAELMASYSQFFAEVQNPKNTKVNPFLKNKYAPLDVVLNCLREPMSSNGLSFMQIPTVEGENVKVDTLLMHSGGAYMSIEGIAIKPKKMDAQEIGGVITYIRRYTISAICGISSEEDGDGNDGTAKKNKKQSTPEDLKKLALTTLKTKLTTLAKDKMSEAGKDPVTNKIAEILGEGKTVSKSQEEDKENLVKLYVSLSSM